MDNWIAAFKTIGGLTAIGGLIDLVMYTSEKAKLKALLEDWWLRFVDVKWSNFGRAEAELAIQILDRWAGPRLWSWKRWRLSTIVTLLVAVLTIIWTLVRNEDPKNFHTLNALGFSTPFFLALPSIVSLALSLSVTRFIAVRAAQLCKGRLASVTVFIGLLILHVFLLVYWSTIVFIVELTGIMLAIEVAARVAGTTVFALQSPDHWFAIIRDILDEAGPDYGSTGVPWPKAWRLLFSFRPVGLLGNITGCPSSDKLIRLGFI